MTYTEQDLRAVLGALESDAPEVAGTLVGVDRLRRRRTVHRRVAGMTAVAAVTVALAAGALAVPDLVRSNEQPAAASSDVLRFRFGVDDIPGATVRFNGFDDTRQSAQVDRPGAIVVAITVYEHGGYDSSAARGGEPVDVNGKPGFFRTEMPCSCLSTPMPPGVAWEYAPDSWVLVHLPWSGPITRDELLRIARAVRFDRTTQFRVPYKIGYLPPGLVPSGATLQGSVVHPEVTVTLTGGPDSTDLLTIRASTPPDRAPTAIPDMNGTVTANLGRFSVSLTAGTTGRGGPAPGRIEPSLSDEELRKVAQSITEAGSWPDPAGWIEAGQAFPTR